MRRRRAPWLLGFALAVPPATAAEAEPHTILPAVEMLDRIDPLPLLPELGAVQPPAAEAAAFEETMNEDERELVQRALVWLGLYDGWIDGVFGDRTRAAITAWQRAAGRAESGVLSQDEVVDLLADGLVVEARLGWRTVVDPETELTIGYPAALLTAALPNDSGGTDYVDPIGSGVLSTMRLRDVRPGAIDVFYDLLRRSESDGRRILYDVRRGPLFILAGEWAGGGFYERYEQRGAEIRGYKLLWAPWEADRYGPISVAVSNSFYPFGGAPLAPGVYPQLGPLVARAVAAMDRAATPVAGDLVPAATAAAEPDGTALEGTPASPDAGVASGPDVMSADAPPSEETVPDTAVADAAEPPPALPLPADAGRQGGPSVLGLPQQASGSGFVIDRGGTLLTSAHVIAGCGAIEIGGVGHATIRAVDERRDLALLDTPVSFASVVPVRAGGTIELGEPVTVLGYPYRGIVSTSLTITEGIVSALAGLDDDPSRFQLSAAIQPGNSGGPVLDEAGRLIGVVVARIDDAFIASATGTLPQNVNFGIRLELVESFLLENGIVPERSEDLTPQTPREVARAIGGLVHPVICTLGQAQSTGER